MNSYENDNPNNTSATDSLLPPENGPPPKDRCKVVYLIFCLLGLGSLLPWNFFITAKEYYHFKLRNTSLPEGSDIDDPATQPQLETLFEGSVAVASTIPNVLMNFITALLSRRIALRSRMIWSAVTIILLFALTLSLVGINTDTWQVPFFGVTMISVVFLSAASSVFIASQFGLAGKFPEECMEGAVNGQALGGVFAAVANLVSLVAGSSVIDSAYGYFGAAVFTMILTLIGYIMLYNLEYSRYYIYYSHKELNIQGDEDARPSLVDEEKHIESSSMGAVIKKIWREGVSVMFVFTVTLSCYPAITSSIQSISGWSQGKYFSAVVCFLLFNLGDWTGRVAAGFIKFPRFNQTRTIMVLSLLRVVYIPLLLLCNAEPRSLPVIFNHDVYPIVFILTLGLTNGYLCTICMMYGPKKVLPADAEFAGTSMSVFITAGLASGSLVSLAFVKLINL